MAKNRHFFCKYKKNVVTLQIEISYKIPSLPNREFGGYEFLAWYYVSWARAIPEKLSSLGLPFHDAYESALQLYNKKKS